MAVDFTWKFWHAGSTVFSQVYWENVHHFQSG